MSDERKWADLTPEERAARISAGRRAAAETRAQTQAQHAREIEDLAARMARSGDLIGDDELPPPESGDEATEAPSVTEPDADERRRQLLQGIDPEIAALFTDEDLLEMENAALTKARDERRAKAKKTLQEAMLQRARVENDLIPASVLLSKAELARKNELKTFRFFMPKRGTSQNVRVDGRLYQSGAWYTEPYHVMESIRRQHYLVHLHEVQFRELDQDKVFKPGDDPRGFTPAMILLADNPPKFEIAA